MRNQGRVRMGYFPLALREAQRIKAFLKLPDAQCAVLDPCAGCGTALVEMTSDRKASRHLATWTCVKVVDKIEEVEDGVTTIRERERFAQTLTLAFHDGLTGILTDGTKGAG